MIEFEKTCITERKFKGNYFKEKVLLKHQWIDAELANQRIEELRLQEIEYRTVMTKEKSKQEVNFNPLKTKSSSFPLEFWIGIHYQFSIDWI